MRLHWYIVAVMVSLLGVAAVLLFKGSAHVGVTDIAKKADAVVAACASSNDHAACYEREVPALYPKLSLPSLFSVVRLIRQKDSSYQFCHVLGHKIGEQIVSEDPNKWVDAIPFNPTDGLCSNGYIHGVIGGRFRAEVLDDATLQKLLPDFRRACEAHSGWSPSDLDRAMCYHAMGHLYVYITNANITNALSICEQSTTEQFNRVCREGVFMQIYQPLEPDDYALIEQMPVKPTPSTVRSFCASFGANPSYEGACLRESWPMHEGMYDGTGVKSFCSGQPNSEEEMACYQSATAIIGRMSLGDADKAASACRNVPSQWQDLCFATTAQAVLEENRDDASKAISLCKLAEDSVAQNCMMSLARRASFIFGTNAPEMYKFCNNLPESLQSSCR